MILTLFYFVRYVIPRIDYIPMVLDTKQQKDFYMFLFDMVQLHNIVRNIYYIYFQNHVLNYIFQHFVVMN